MTRQSLILVAALAFGCGNATTPDAGADLGAGDGAAVADLVMASRADLATCLGTPRSCGAAGACIECPAPPNSEITCMANQCGATCKQGASSCHGQCVDTMSAALDCGRCGHSCFGGSCAGGRCAPSLLGEVFRASDVAVDAYNVYVTDIVSGSVNWVPIIGGNVPAQIADKQGSPMGIAVDAKFVYWTAYDDGTVMKVASPAAGGGGKPVALAMGQGKPADLAIDGTNVYWVNAGDGRVMKVSLGGGNAVALATGQGGPGHIAIDANNVYWTNATSGTVMKVAIGGGNPVQLAAGQMGPAGVAVDAKNVYWVDTGGGSVQSVPIVGGNVTTVAVGQMSPLDIAVDADGIYWSNYADGNVGSVMALLAGTKMPVAIAAPPDSTGPSGVTTDAMNVYFVDRAVGSIVRISK